MQKLASAAFNSVNSYIWGCYPRGNFRAVQEVRLDSGKKTLNWIPFGLSVISSDNGHNKPSPRAGFVIKERLAVV
jgi:hypothetical protein